VTIVKVTHKEGTGKNGRPYSFYVASIIDEDFNVFNLNLSDELVKTAAVDGEIITEITRQDREVDVEFRPKGFDCAGTIVAW